MGMRRSGSWPGSVRGSTSARPHGRIRNSNWPRRCYAPKAGPVAGGFVVGARAPAWARRLILLFNLSACRCFTWRCPVWCFCRCRGGVRAGGWVIRVGARGRVGRIWCAGRQGGFRAEVAKPSANACRGEPARSGGGFLPRAAEVFGEVAGQPELGVRGDDQPGPAVRGLGGAQAGPGPVQGLFEEPERVFDVEAAQVGVPESVKGGGGRLRG